jgi:two-component system, OmpR family, alkaline phosphatase synthesis response regulator PhoP
MAATILVADDEPDLLFMTSFTLRSLGGFEVIEAHNGEEALELALRRRPALLVLDIKMPRLTGYDVCKHIRQEPQLAHTPIILLSAKGQKTELDAGWEAGATEYILKPYAPDVLVKRVQELLGAS